MGILNFTNKDLIKIVENRDIDGLINALGHKDGFIRYNAAEALGEFGGEIAVDPLIKTLNDEDVRSMAVFALGQIGDK